MAIVVKTFLIKQSYRVLEEVANYRYAVRCDARVRVVPLAD
jgi:hypothetical protein